MYKILDLLPTTVEVRDINPSQLNYKTQLTECMNKNMTMTKGRVLNVEYTSHAGDLILDVSIVYNDSTNDVDFPLSRVTTRKWYDITGINHNLEGFDKTTKTKLYNPTETVKEGQRRRHNIIQNLFSMATSLGKGAEAAQRMLEHSAEILAYETVYDTTLITGLQNDTTHLWLDDVFPLDTTKTFRQVIVAGLTI